jgi:hypothetical protein
VAAIKLPIQDCDLELSVSGHEVWLHFKLPSGSAASIQPICIHKGDIAIVADIIKDWHRNRVAQADALADRSDET